MNKEDFKNLVLTIVGDIEDKIRANDTRKYATIDEICTKLKENGFKFLNSGCYKKVFRHDRYKDYVVKTFVYDTTVGKFPPGAVAEHYLTPFFENKHLMLQEYANGIGGTSDDAYEYFNENYPDVTGGKYDVHAENVRYHNGMPVIIDF